jgi:hypothetical protein
MSVPDRFARLMVIYDLTLTFRSRQASHAADTRWRMRVLLVRGFSIVCEGWGRSSCH